MDTQPPHPAPSITRRRLLGTAATAPALALAAGFPAPAAEPEKSVGPSPRGAFLLGLNTSTIRGQKLSIVEEIAIAAAAGFQGMEPWLDELNRYVEGGGSLEDLGKRFRDAGIRVESAIDFFEWAVDDDARRKKALEAARKSMAVLQKIGATRLAAPPVGATDHPVDPRRVAERYRALLTLGDEMGVVPQAEVWGFSKTLGRLGEAAQIVIEADHPRACILPDVFHLFKGGSSLEGVRLLSPAAIRVFHVNDYPASPAREKLTDADRVYPGDGVAPYRSLLRNLSAGGFQVMLSLELFNRALWNQDPLEVAKTGFSKLKALVQEAVPVS